MKPKVSVILPTFNRSRSLAMAAESVLNQTFTDLELIIVDDASSDDTEAAVCELQDGRVRYLKRESNGGASAARNTGIAAARGRFIAFQDSDDLWLPGKLSRQMSTLESLPEDVGVVTGSKILYGRDSAHNYGAGKVTCAPRPGDLLSLDEDQLQRFLAGNRISLQNALFRRSCFPGDCWFDVCAKANADWEFTARLARYTRVYEDIDPVVLAFISNDSISKDPKKKIIGLLRLIKNNREQLARYSNIYAKHLVRLGVMLFKAGKTRWAIRFVLAGIKRRPAAILALASRAKRRFNRRFASLSLGRS